MAESSWWGGEKEGGNRVGMREEGGRGGGPARKWRQTYALVLGDGRVEAAKRKEGAAERRPDVTQYNREHWEADGGVEPQWRAAVLCFWEQAGHFSGRITVFFT